MKMFEHVESLHPVHVDTMWLVYYRSRWPEYMAVCFHVAAVASGGAIWHGGWWWHGCGMRDAEAVSGRRYATRDGSDVNMGGETMNEVTHPASLSSALPLVATVTWGRDESNPNSKRTFLFEVEEHPSPSFFRTSTHGTVFLKITGVS